MARSAASSASVTTSKRDDFSRTCSSATVPTYWHALRQCAIEDKVQGFGRLLAVF